jgi:alanyl-tRNA synthetase
VATVSFHLGSDASTIDLEREVTADEVRRAAELANQTVRQNRSVGIRFVSAVEAERLPLRKEPTRTGVLRLIDIDGVDLSACGGTHVARTGEIGAILVRRWERFKGRTRVEFLCGARAVRSYELLRDAVDDAVRHLSVAPQELGDAIARLQDGQKALRKTLKEATGRLAGFEAATLADDASELSGVACVARVVDGYDAGDLRTLASSVLATPGRAVVLVTASEPVAIVVGRSSNIEVDAASVVSALVERFGGRGGGRPDFAQGGGFAATPDDVLAAARELVAARLAALEAE